MVRGSLLVDYKTGKPNTELSARYDDQLRLYAAALHQLAGPATMEAVLYYVDTGDTRSVDTSPGILADTLARAKHALDAPISA